MRQLEDVKFLLVDDLDENLLALEALLRRDGLELFKARSGEEALELLLKHDFALALLDVQMNRMDGFELAELMRGTERTRRVPIIFLTAVATDERRRFRGYEAGAVDYLFKPVDGQVLLSKATIFFELARQRQEISFQRDELRGTALKLAEALDLLQAHGDNSPLACVQLDPEFRITAWWQGAERLFGWTADEAIGRTVTELGWLGMDAVAAFEAMTAELQERGRSVVPLRAVRKDGSEIECEWYASALIGSDGKLASVSAQILDVTERKRAEETQRLLIGELNHRVKNMLATVQAIAGQTVRHASDPTEFAEKFSGRIQSLARVHSLLSSSTWKGAKVADLVREQLSAGAVDAARLTASGPDTCLAPQLALHLAMILHELGTNAIKYGALSNPLGRIAVCWALVGDQLHLTWTESGAKVPTLPTRRGFGTSLIEQSVSAEGGSAVAAYNPDGIVWEIKVPVTPPTGATDAQRASALIQHEQQKAAKYLNGDGTNEKTLHGRRILIVEDEPLIALELATILQGVGAVVVGPAGTPEEALRFIDENSLDGVLLDGNLKGRPINEIATVLVDRKVPFVFVSGYGRDDLPASFAKVPLLGKPFDPGQLLDAAMQIMPLPAAPNRDHQSRPVPQTGSSPDKPCD